MKKIKVGLLPLYVKLYDDYLSWMRPRVDAFHAEIVRRLSETGLEVITTSPCRLEEEFRAAIRLFEKNGAKALVTLHLGYSPSLQSEKPLKECRLPIIILDTTQDYEFSPEGSPADLDYDHGIHGVQDMCNLLIRNGKKFRLFTGHYSESDVLKKVSDCVRGYAAAEALAGARVGIIGEPFEGMGDFRLPFETLKKDVGIEVKTVSPKTIGQYAEKVSEDRIRELRKSDGERFRIDGVPEERYREVTRVSLGVKDWYESEGLTAFTINFLSAGKTTGLRHMPFDRACRAMEEGVGYAGEGDVVTAALVGALLGSWEETSFVEMFCPNWKDGYVFFYHMGEFNLAIAGKKPRMTLRPFPFSDTGDPYALSAPMKEGKAVLVNLAPFGEGRYTLTAVNGRMLPVSEKSNFTAIVNGWFKPDTDLREMLKKYSENGGTHHSALVYGIDADAVAPMAEKFGWKYVVI